MTIRVRYDGNVLIPVDPVDLPRNQVLEMQLLEPPSEPPRGSPAALLKAIAEGPHISAEDAAELERVIEEGKMPVCGGLLPSDQSRVSSKR